MQKDFKSKRTKSGIFEQTSARNAHAGQQKVSGLIIIVGGCNYRIAGAKIEVDDQTVMHHANAQSLTQRPGFWWISTPLFICLW